jgi:hypothetical protein
VNDFVIQNGRGLSGETIFEQDLQD